MDIYIYISLLQEDEMKRWVGLYANQHPHMGDRTSSKVESWHSGLKRALGHQPAATICLTTRRMHNYYEAKVQCSMFA